MLDNFNVNITEKAYSKLEELVFSTGYVADNIIPVILHEPQYYYAAYDLIYRQGQGI